MCGHNSNLFPFIETLWNIQFLFFLFSRLLFQELMPPVPFHSLDPVVLILSGYFFPFLKCELCYPMGILTHVDFSLPVLQQFLSQSWYQTEQLPFNGFSQCLKVLSDVRCKTRWELAFLFILFQLMTDHFTSPIATIPGPC